MAFMDDLKTDQRTQILVAGVIFFAIAFPVYFNFAASNVDEVKLSGPVGVDRIVHLKYFSEITKKILRKYNYKIKDEGEKIVVFVRTKDE